MNMLALMYVAFGGAIGSMGRYLLVSALARFTTTDYPYGTLAVNILGGLLLGLWVGAMAYMMPNRAKDLHLLIAVGALGGFTTFSAFSLDVILLMERGGLIQAALYAAASVLLSVAALFAGMWVTRFVAG